MTLNNGDRMRKYRAFTVRLLMCVAALWGTQELLAWLRAEAERGWRTGPIGKSCWPGVQRLE